MAQTVDLLDKYNDQFDRGEDEPLDTVTHYWDAELDDDPFYCAACGRGLDNYSAFDSDDGIIYCEDCCPEQPAGESICDDGSIAVYPLA